MSCAGVVKSTTITLATALSLAACGGDSKSSSDTSVSPSTRTSSGGRTTTSTASSAPQQSASSGFLSANPSALKDLAAVDVNSLETKLIGPVAVARFAPDMARSEDTGSEDFSGEGGTCPQLAKIVSSPDVFVASTLNEADVSYSNVDAVGQSFPVIRTVQETIENYPDLNTRDELAKTRTAISGCMSPLVDTDGAQVTIRLDPAVSAGDGATLSFSAVLSTRGQQFENDILILVSGHNVLQLTSGGFPASQRAGVVNAALAALRAK